MSSQREFHLRPLHNKVPKVVFFETFFIFVNQFSLNFQFCEDFYELRQHACPVSLLCCVDCRQPPARGGLSRQTRQNLPRSPARNQFVSFFFPSFLNLLNFREKKNECKSWNPTFSRNILPRAQAQNETNVICLRKNQQQYQDEFKF